MSDRPATPELVADILDRINVEMEERIAGGGVDYIGLQTGFLKLDEATLGLRPNAYYIVGARSSMGKALAIDTPIPTPTGWTTMGNIQVGDKVFDEQGNICHVTWVRPIEIDEVQYRITFNDGTTIDACADHRWLTSTHQARQSLMNAQRHRNNDGTIKPKGSDQSYKRTYPSVVTTQQIRDTLYHTDGTLNHRIENTKALQLPEQRLPIAPYTLGAWLGDGTSGASSICTMDTEILDEIAKDGYNIGVARKTSGKTSKASMYTIGGTNRRGGDMRLDTSLQRVFREQNLLNNKHIPLIYLRASYEQRFALLAGLMDTDGSVLRGTACEIIQKNEVLADQICELITTFGWKYWRTEKFVNLNGKRCGPYHRINFYPDVAPFRLERKIDRFIPSSMSTSKGRLIASVEPIERVPMRCITVNSPSHLFLAGKHMIPTHNTAFATSVMKNVAQANNSVLYISLEMSSELILYRLLSSLSGVPEMMIETGRVTNEELRKVRQAQEELHSLPIHFYDRTMNMNQFREILINSHEKNDHKLVIVDYLSLLQSAAGNGIYERITNLSESMRLLARDVDLPFMVLAQLNREAERREDKTPVLADLRDSGSLEQDSHATILLHRPHYYDKLYNGTEPKNVEDDAVIILAKNRQGNTGRMKATFIADRMEWTDPIQLDKKPQSLSDLI